MKVITKAEAWFSLEHSRGRVTFTIAAVQAFVKAKNAACVGCHREVLRSFIVAKREAGAVPRYL